MNDIFKLHFNSSGPSGGSMSSRHMNRNQARQVIRENIINKYLLYCNDGGISPDILKDIVAIERRLGQKFYICQPIDANFKNFLRCSGSVYWCFTLEFHILSASRYGIVPETLFGVLLDSVIFYSKKQDVTYRILNVNKEIELSSTTLVENARLIDELDSKYGMLDALVDGYMWGQSHEDRYLQMYFDDVAYAPADWMDISQEHFVWERKQFETDISDVGNVVLKQLN